MQYILGPWTLQTLYNLLAQLPGADSQDTIVATPGALDKALQEARDNLDKEAAASSKPVPTPARGDTAPGVTRPGEHKESDKEWEGSHYYWQKWDGYGSYYHDQYDYQGSQWTPGYWRHHDSPSWSWQDHGYDWRSVGSQPTEYFTPEKPTLHRGVSLDSLPSVTSSSAYGNLLRSTTVDQLGHLQGALTLLPDGPEKHTLQQLLGTTVRQTLEPSLAAAAIAQHGSADNTKPEETMTIEPAGLPDQAPAHATAAEHPSANGALMTSDEHQQAPERAGTSNSTEQATGSGQPDQATANAGTALPRAEKAIAAEPEADLKKVAGELGQATAEANTSNGQGQQASEAVAKFSPENTTPKPADLKNDQHDQATADASPAKHPTTQEASTTKSPGLQPSATANTSSPENTTPNGKTAAEPADLKNDQLAQQPTKPAGAVEQQETKASATALATEPNTQSVEQKKAEALATAPATDPNTQAVEQKEALATAPEAEPNTQALEQKEALATAPALELTVEQKKPEAPATEPATQKAAAEPSTQAVVQQEKPEAPATAPATEPSTQPSATGAEAPASKDCQSATAPAASATAKDKPAAAPPAPAPDGKRKADDAQQGDHKQAKAAKTGDEGKEKDTPEAPEADPEETEKERERRQKLDEKKKAAHARYMKYFRSLTSPALSTSTACIYICMHACSHQILYTYNLHQSPFDRHVRCQLPARNPKDWENGHWPKLECIFKHCMYIVHMHVCMRV